MNNSTQKINLSELNLKETVIQIKRVTKVVKGGRTLKFRALVVVGNEAGVVGYGVGKAKDPREAVKKAVYKARKKLIRVPLTKGTIPHSIEGKYNATRVKLRPASPGTGVLAGGGVRAVLQCTGVPNILAKLNKANNRCNAVRATISGLQSLRSAVMVAQDRGITLDKVFNG